MNEIIVKKLTNLRADKTPEAETIDYSQFSDSTSVMEIVNFVENHTLVDNASIFDNITDFLERPIPRDEAEKKVMVKSGIKLLGKFTSLFEMAEICVDAVFTMYKIKRGLILVKMKQLVRKAGESWDAWATTHVPYISQRTRIDEMKLGSRSDCHPYYVLGSERLLLLIRATEGQKSDNPIGDFMKKHRIRFDPKSGKKIKKFKVSVDTALNMEKLEKVGVKADGKIVHDLTAHIPEMDKKLISTTKAINDSGGDVNEYLKRLVLTKGKEADPFEGQKASADFNTTGEKLIHIINYVLKNDDAIEYLEGDIVTELLEKLTELKKLANIQ